MATYQSTAEIEDGRVALYAQGNALEFERNGLIYYARSGNTTTAATCPAYTSLLPGLRFVLDNSNGSGSMTITPATGTPIVVTTGKVYDCIVAANGSIKAAELAAAPT